MEKTRQEIVGFVRKEAEGYFHRGEFFCSEAVIHTINRLMGFPLPQEISKLASAFPIGLGKSGCLCGAVSGGAMALGLAYGRNHGQAMRDEIFPITAKLHDFIREKYKSTCCRVLVRNYEFDSPERKAHCVQITGEVAAWVAGELLKDPEIYSKIKIGAKKAGSLYD